VSLETGHKLVYSALADLATFVLLLGVGIPLVYFFSKALKHLQTVVFSEKKKEVVFSL